MEIYNKKNIKNYKLVKIEQPTSIFLTKYCDYYSKC